VPKHLEVLADVVSSYKEKREKPELDDAAAVHSNAGHRVYGKTATQKRVALESTRIEI
jgi:hypothetical protein